MIYRKQASTRPTTAPTVNFPIRQDRIGVMIILALAIGGPFVRNDYGSTRYHSVLILSLAAIGLNADGLRRPTVLRSANS